MKSLGGSKNECDVVKQDTPSMRPPTPAEMNTRLLWSPRRSRLIFSTLLPGKQFFNRLRAIQLRASKLRARRRNAACSTGYKRTRWSRLHRVRDQFFAEPPRVVRGMIGGTVRVLPRAHLHMSGFAGKAEYSRCIIPRAYRDLNPDPQATSPRYEITMFPLLLWRVFPHVASGISRATF